MKLEDGFGRQLKKIIKYKSEKMALHVSCTRHFPYHTHMLKSRNSQSLHLEPRKKKSTGKIINNKLVALLAPKRKVPVAFNYFIYPLLYPNLKEFSSTAKLKQPI